MTVRIYQTGINVKPGSINHCLSVFATVCRKVQKFLSQPFHVAENFTGVPGKYVPLKETIRGFKAIISGEMDEYPEAAFFNVGTIEDVIEKAKTMG